MTFISCTGFSFQPDKKLPDESHITFNPLLGSTKCVTGWPRYVPWTTLVLGASICFRIAALNSENPKQYDAVVNIIKAMNDTSKNLVGLHGKTTKNNTIVEGSGSVNINNTYNYTQELKDAEKLVDGLDDIIDGEIS